MDRIQPIDDLNTWEKINEKLADVYKKPITYELAQNELNIIKHQRNESMEDYSKRIRQALAKLNTATRILTG